MQLPAYFTQDSRPDGMEEHPPNISITLLLVNLKYRLPPFTNVLYRCMALSFAIEIYASFINLVYYIPNYFVRQYKFYSNFLRRQ